MAGFADRLQSISLAIEPLYQFIPVVFQPHLIFKSPQRDYRFNVVSLHLILGKQIAAFCAAVQAALAACFGVSSILNITIPDGSIFDGPHGPAEGGHNK